MNPAGFIQKVPVGTKSINDVMPKSSNSHFIEYEGLRGLKTDDIKGAKPKSYGI